LHGAPTHRDVVISFEQGLALTVQASTPEPLLTQFFHLAIRLGVLRDGDDLV
jgi:hypothetical protein